MDVPPDTADEPRSIESNYSEPFSFTRFFFSFAIALILYALSPGPVAKCLRLDKRPVPPAFHVIYAPLVFCGASFSPVSRFYDWYMKEVWHL